MAMMTLDEFLAELQKTERDWFLSDERKWIVRRRNFDTGEYFIEDPIRAVANMREPRLDRLVASKAAKFIGLDYDWVKIRCAAENHCCTAETTALRQELLKACGVGNNG